MVTTSVNLHDLKPAAQLLHGEEEVVYGNSGYQGIANRPVVAGKGTELQVAMRPGKRRSLLDRPEGRLQDLLVTAKVHIRSKVEHPFRLIFAKPAAGRSSSSAFKRLDYVVWQKTAAKSMWSVSSPFYS